MMGTEPGRNPTDHVDAWVLIGPVELAGHVLGLHHAELALIVLDDELQAVPAVTQRCFEG